MRPSPSLSRSASKSRAPEKAPLTAPTIEGAPLSLLEFAFDEEVTRPLYRPPTPPSNATLPSRGSSNPLRESNEWKEAEVLSMSKKNWERASFFPYSYLHGLGSMAGVLAVTGEDEIRLLKTSDEPGPSNLFQARLDLLCSHRIKETGSDTGLLALSWSVKIREGGYVPILAVAGRGRRIYIYEVTLAAPGATKMSLRLDRTLLGHGKTIRDICFSPRYPHCLASASDDSQIFLWDIDAAGGSNEEVVADPANRRSSEKCQRPTIPGELRGKLIDQGQHGGFISIDLHPRLPLLVSSSFDGLIRIWDLPPDRLGPTWPGLPSGTSFHSRSSFEGQTPFTLGSPVFRSTQIHPGVWCDQVLWASPSSTFIFSKAQEGQPPFLNVESREPSPSPDQPKPKKNVKLWIPDVLTSNWHEGFNPLKDQPLSFKVYGQITVDDQNYVTDKIGMYRSNALAPATSKETLLAIQNFDTWSVELVTPFSKSAVAQTLDPLISSKQDTTSLAVVLFPPDRDRIRNDYSPRIRAESQTPAMEKKQHLRSVALDPRAGEWVVGVGSHGVVRAWKKVLNGGGGGEPAGEDPVKQYLTSDIDEVFASSSSAAS